MKNPYIIVPLLFVIVISALSRNSLFNEIAKLSGLNENEFLLVVYLNPATCVKCYIEPFDIINYIEKNKRKAKFKYLAMVKCDREIELKVFKRETGWKYYSYVDDGTSLKKLGGEGKTVISILNHNGENQLNLREMQVMKNRKLVRGFLKGL